MGIITQVIDYSQLIEGSGYFFYVKMPGYRLASLAAATPLHFTALCIQLLLAQNPTACIAYLPVQAAVANC
jgi:hypothetical protein